MLWPDDNIRLPNNHFSSLVQLKSLEKRLLGDRTLTDSYAKDIHEDLEKNYLITVADSYMVEQPSDKEWYLTHHPVIKPNKPGKLLRVLNGAAKFLGTSLNKSLLTHPRPSPELNPCSIEVTSTSICLVLRYRGYVPPGWCPHRNQPSLRFFRGGRALQQTL